MSKTFDDKQIEEKKVDLLIKLNNFVPDEDMPDVQRQVTALIEQAKVDIDEDYLLECFESVAQYAQDSYQLGGMKPETALHNYRNRIDQRREGSHE